MKQGVDDRWLDPEVKEKCLKNRIITIIDRFVLTVCFLSIIWLLLSLGVSSSAVYYVTSQMLNSTHSLFYALNWSSVIFWWICYLWWYGATELYESVLCFVHCIFVHSVYVWSRCGSFSLGWRQSDLHTDTCSAICTGERELHSVWGH